MSPLDNQIWALDLYFPIILLLLRILGVAIRSPNPPHTGLYKAAISSVKTAIDIAGAESDSAALS